MKFRQKTLLAKIEATYGVDSTPGAANAMLVKDVELTAMEAESIDRDLVKPFLGASETITSGAHVSLSFKIEHQGSGTAGTPPAYKDLLRACGLAEIISVGVSVEYLPISDSAESASLYFYMSDNLHKLIGARGNVKSSFEKGIPYLEFSFIGLWADPAKIVAPTPDWSAFQKPTPTGKGVTSGFSLLGYAAKPYSLSVDLGQDAKYIETLTTETIDLNDRKSSGSVSIEAPNLDVHNFFLDAKNDVVGSLAIQHGQVAGLICKIDCPKVQIGAPKYGDNEGTTSLEMDLVLIPTAAGDDELKFTFM
ncbi:MAG: hypothetical protein JKY26_01640 [Pseudomonas sp.]|nr:hypothetical protein [Pseudomonas sp.]